MGIRSASESLIWPSAEVTICRLTQEVLLPEERFLRSALFSFESQSLVLSCNAEADSSIGLDDERTFKESAQSESALSRTLEQFSEGLFPSRQRKLALEPCARVQSASVAERCLIIVNLIRS